MHIPKGFEFAVTSAGFKKKDKPDLAVVVSHTLASAAGVFTQNIFKAAPVLVAHDFIKTSPTARAVLVNSGQANACTGERGRENCLQTIEMTAETFSLPKAAILPASTGVIGEHLHMEKWHKAQKALKQSFGRATAEDMAKAITTTDSFYKMSSTAVTLYNKKVTVLGMAKGAGMICPNMATLIGVILTDAKINPDLWQRVLQQAVSVSFNRITIDGDTSTNDTVFGLANGVSDVLISKGEEEALLGAVSEVCQNLAYMIVQDAEGGTKVLDIKISGAQTASQAELAARAVGHSSLVKTAMYGQDPNWGRITAAIGRSGALFQAEDVRISLCGVELFKDGCPVDMDIDAVMKGHLEKKDITIEVILGDGPGEYVLLASDLTHDYVTINADYRT